MDLPEAVAAAQLGFVGEFEGGHVVVVVVECTADIVEGAVQKYPKLPKAAHVACQIAGVLVWLRPHHIGDCLTKVFEQLLHESTVNFISSGHHDYSLVLFSIIEPKE